MTSSTYRFRRSQHAKKIMPLFRDTLDFLRVALDLPSPFKPQDPGLGERWAMISPQSIPNSPTMLDTYRCQFQACAAFPTLQEATDWSVEKGVDFLALLPQVKNNINQRDILDDFVCSGDLYTGKPRMPLKGNGAQAPSIFIVELSCPCALKLLIFNDPLYGHYL